jgi:hypothetical protein
MAVALTLPAARVDHGESISPELPGCGVADTSTFNIRWMCRSASVSAHARLSRGELPAHHGQLDFHYFGPRPVVELAALTGVVGENLVVRNALTPDEVRGAYVSAYPRRR